MKRLFLLSVVTEIVTSFVLMIDPQLVSQLLFKVDLSQGGVGLARIAALTLFSLGVACWPGLKLLEVSRRALLGMLAYNFLAAIYLVYVWVEPHLVGPLLIPAVLVHAFFALVFFKMFFTE